MINRVIFLVIVLLAVAFFFTASETRAREEPIPADDTCENDFYAYACEVCPANWHHLRHCENGTLVRNNSCSGEAQSPICIDTKRAKRKRLPRLRFEYGVTDLEMKVPHGGQRHNPTNIEAFAEEAGHTLLVGGDEYEFCQVHFHTLSEHFIDGEQLPMVAHLVHKSPLDGSVVVVARFVEIGASNAALQPLVDKIVALTSGPAGTELDDFDLEAFVPDSKCSYRYTGSTTSPPCSEGILWILIAEPLEMSVDQVLDIRGSSSTGGLLAINDGFDNVRPIQSLNGREVCTDCPRSKRRGRKSGKSGKSGKSD